MSEYTPAYDLTDRWLENGKVIDGTKLTTELDNMATAINSTDHSGSDGERESDYSIIPGRRIRYPISRTASSKWCVYSGNSTRDSENTHMSIDLSGSYAVDATNDSAFTIIPLTAGANFNYSSTEDRNVATYPEYGSRFLDLELTFYIDTTAAVVHHPQRSGYSDANAVIIRDASNFSGAEDGHHPLPPADDVDLAIIAAATTVKRTVRIRNTNQSFALRVGSNVTFGSGSRLGVRIIGYDY